MQFTTKLARNEDVKQQEHEYNRKNVFFLYSLSMLIGRQEKRRLVINLTRSDVDLDNSRAFLQLL